MISRWMSYECYKFSNRNVDGTCFFNRYFRSKENSESDFKNLSLNCSVSTFFIVFPLRVPFCKKSFIWYLSILIQLDI